jgi:hypothetical protein
MSSVKTLYKSGGRLNSSKFAEKKRKQKVTIFFLSVLCLVTLLATVILLLRSSLFKVNSIMVKSPPNLSADLLSDLPVEAIKSKALATIQADTGKNVWGIFPADNILFVSKSKLEKTLQDTFKEINTITIKKTGFQEITLSVQERIPVAIVCFSFLEGGSAADGNTGALNCFYSDRHGYIFSSISSSTILSSFTKISSSVSLPSFATLDSYSYYYVPTDKATSPLGTTFVTEKRFEELENLTNGAHQGGLSPLGILIGDNGEYELYVKNKKGDSEVTIYFDDKVPFDTTLSNLLTFWQNPLGTAGVKGKKATTTPAFDYINLRFGNTVYYSTQ